MSEAVYCTTLARAALALVVGAMVASPLTMLVLLGPAIAEDAGQLNEYLPQLAFVLIAAAIVYAIGLVFLAAPCWLLLHRQGHRSWRVAAALGGALGFVVTFLLYVSPTFPIRPEGSSSSFGGSEGMLVEDNVVTALGWTTFLGYSVVYGLLCSVIGILIWRIAYRRVSAASA